MRDNAQIRLNDPTTDVRLVWVAFDGDDCFNDFHIDVTSQSGTQRFSFGGCAVHGLRHQVASLKRRILLGGLLDGIAACSGLPCALREWYA